MDPLGLAMENFDAVGLWRINDHGEKIDSTGTLPTGEDVKHAGDLIRVLRTKYADEFARCLTEKLMIYALGRGLEYYDKCTVDKIVAKPNRITISFQQSLWVLSNPMHSNAKASGRE